MPDLEILTARLKLDRLEPRDAAMLYAYRTHPAVSRYQGWAPASLDEAARFIRDQRSIAFDTPGTWFQFAIRLRESGLLAGDLGVRFPEDARQVEIGFTLAPEHQHRGYAREAVAAVLDHLFEVFGKHRVFASVDPRNEASLALLRRLGFRQEAHFRESIWFKGEWADDLVFGLLKSEWRKRGTEAG